MPATNGTKERKGKPVEVEKSPRLKGKPEAPVFGDLVKGIVPMEDHEMFFRYAVNRPRLLAIISKPELTQDDKDELAAAYDAFKEEEKKSVALIWEEAVALAPLIGVSEEKTRSYLEVYKPEDLKKLALVAQREELEAKDVIDVDLSLLLDGSYLGRDRETLTVSSVHGTLTRLIDDELSRIGAHRAIRKEDTNLDTLWTRLLAQHEGDEEKAAAEYAQAAEEILATAKGKGSEKAGYTLEVDLVVSVFKLFNYHLGDIQSFLEHVEHNFNLETSSNAGDVERIIFSSLLGEFVEENANAIVLNERSSLYQRARARQIDTLVAMEEASLLATGEVKDTKPLGKE
jgi:hypothetical protein